MAACCSVACACSAAAAAGTAAATVRACASEASERCSFNRAAWYSLQVSTASALAFCIACTMLSSFTLPKAITVDSTTTLMPTARFSLRLPPPSGAALTSLMRVTPVHAPHRACRMVRMTDVQRPVMWRNGWHAALVYATERSANHEIQPHLSRHRRAAARARLGRRVAGRPGPAERRRASSATADDARPGAHRATQPELRNDAQHAGAVHQCAGLGLQPVRQGRHGVCRRAAAELTQYGERLAVRRGLHSALTDCPASPCGSSPPKGAVASPWGGPAAALDIGVACGADPRR